MADSTNGSAPATVTNVADYVADYNGTFSTRFGDLPLSSQIALVDRAFSHLHGNEVASRVVAKIRAVIRDAAVAAQPEATRKDFAKEYEVSKELVQAFRDDNKELVQKMYDESHAAIHRDLLDGKLGVRAASAPKDPLGALVHAVAKEQVVEALTKMGVKVPKSNTDLVKFSNGDTRTMPEMIANKLKANGDAIKREADRRLKAKSAGVAHVKADAASPADAGL